MSIEKQCLRLRADFQLCNRYLITSRPKFQRKNQTTEDEPADFGNMGIKEASSSRRTDSVTGLSGKTAELFDFFQELRHLTPSTTKQESSHGIQHHLFATRTELGKHLMYLFKNSPGPSRGPTHDIVEETCRLSVLFYIAAIKVDSLRFATGHLETLMRTLNETQSAWGQSLEMLLWVCLRGDGPGLENPGTVKVVLSYMEVAKRLQKESWNIVKDMLIGFLCDDLRKAIGIYEDSMLFVADLIRIRG
jgi:hypothetical protein